MSVINFKCAPEKREEVKQKCWEIIHKHYSDSVFPNTKVEYKNEGKDIYNRRLTEIMQSELCNVEETDDGLSFTFDSTEDAGFSIAMGVYGTGMGYSDNGLTFLKPMFNALLENLPDVPFTAECECCDNWVSEEYSCSYDGETFETDAEWDEFDGFDEE